MEITLNQDLVSKRTNVWENLVVAIHRSINIMFIWSCPGMKKLLGILQT